LVALIFVYQGGRMVITIIYVLSGVVVGLISGWWLGKIIEKSKLKRSQEDAEKILKEAKFKTEEIRRKAELDGKKSCFNKLRVDFEKQILLTKET